MFSGLANTFHLRTKCIVECSSNRYLDAQFRYIVVILVTCIQLLLLLLLLTLVMGHNITMYCAVKKYSHRQANKQHKEQVIKNNVKCTLKNIVEYTNACPTAFFLSVDIRTFVLL